MSVADKLTKLTTDITSAYNSIQSKGGTIPAHKNTDNLSTAISSIPTDEWQPQPDWWDIDTILANDTEDYAGKIIMLLPDSEITTTLPIYTAQKIKTSDGLVYNSPSSNINHTWDITKDKPCSYGYKTRYVIYYFNNSAISLNSRINEYALYIICKNLTYSSSYNNNNFSVFNIRLLQAIKFKNCTCTNSGMVYDFTNASGLELYEPPIYTNNINASVRRSALPLVQCYRAQKNMEKILKEEKVIISGDNTRELFRGMQIRYLPDKFDTSNGTSFYFTYVSAFINSIENIDFDSATNVDRTFESCYSLININNISNIKITGLSFSYCNALNHTTLIKILNALYDYSGSGSTYTLTLGATNLAKLTAEEIAIGTNKGWTIN